MHVPDEVALAVKVISGVLWALAYLGMIRGGFRDKVLGIPVTALCANISWEFIFAFVHPHAPPQSYVNMIWFLLSLVMFGQALRYGRSSFHPELAGRWFHPALFCVLLLCGTAVWAVTAELEDWQGKYAAFSQNFLMSVLFVAMCLKRPGVEGQSLYVAWFKLFGTLFPSALFFARYPESQLLTFLYLAILAFDALYIHLLRRRHRALGLNPWRRF